LIIKNGMLVFAAFAGANDGSDLATNPSAYTSANPGAYTSANPGAYTSADLLTDSGPNSRTLAFPITRSHTATLPTAILGPHSFTQ
jgi:hypothetical protein